MDNKLKAEEILEYCRGYLGIKKIDRRLKKEMLAEIKFMLEND